MTCFETTKNEAITSKKSSAASNPLNWRTWIPQGKDLILFFTVLGLVLFGLLMVYSSSFIFAQERTGDGYNYIRRQVCYAIVGFLALGLAYRMDYRRWADWSLAILGSITLSLVLVMVPSIGVRAGGAQRWIHLGFMQLQPAELAKFGLVLFVAYQLQRKQDRLEKFTAGILSSFVATLPTLTLLMLQPDFGSTAMIVIVIFVLMFLAGVPARYLWGAVLTAVAIGGIMILHSPYRQARVLSFANPWKDPSGKGFQILQSMVGLNNGRIMGVGLGNGKEKLFYLPEAHNDFIFAVIGEELGFFGVALVIGAFTFFIFHGLKIAWNCLNDRNDRFGYLLAAGVTLMIGLQAFVNIAVVMGLLPTKGLSLPFISYGGSAIIVDLFAVGVLLSVGREHTRAT